MSAPQLRNVFLHLPQLTFDIVVSSLVVSRSVNARHSYIYQPGKSSVLSVMAMTRGFSGLFDHHHQAGGGVGGDLRKKNVNSAESTLLKQSSTNYL